MPNPEQYPILSSIHTSDDIKALPQKQLPALCEQVRRFLIQSVANTGGHLSSNLGVVELTTALHRVFDPHTDRIFFDVGHQSYVHKLYTGRADDFDKLRTLGGLSGFPKPAESDADPFVAGHASTSVSAALGFSRAAELLGQPYRTVAVIGDGALTGGLAYEALNDAGAYQKPFIVILNDNGISIAKNVGAIAARMSRLRVRKPYVRTKDVFHRAMREIPFGAAFDRLVSRIKTLTRRALIPQTVFESMGFTYVGPVDGHNLNNLIRILQNIKTYNRPVVVHVATVKGKGYPPSENDPQAFHGVGVFDCDSGQCRPDGPSFSSHFGNSLCRLAASDSRIVAVTAAMPDGTGLTDFARLYPDRFFDVGIAEEHAVTHAAALAAAGLRPVVAVYSTFLQRAYDQIVHDTALQSLPVVFAVDRAGLLGPDGETHHGIFDISFLSSVPNMEIFCPATFAELDLALKTALAADHPSAIRYFKGTETPLTCIPSNEAIRLTDGGDMTLVCYGRMTGVALAAAQLAGERGAGVEIIKLNRVKPLDIAPVVASANKTKRLMVLEDVTEYGCVGQRLAAGLAQAGCHPALRLLNCGDRFIPQGNANDLLEHARLDARSVADAIVGFVQVNE